MESLPIKEIVELARDASAVQIFDVIEPTIRAEPIPLISRPYTGAQGEHGVSVDSIKSKLDEWRTAPERRAGTAKMLTLESLIGFANRHKDEDSVLFSTLDGSAPSIMAVFDYHKVDLSPRYGKHRAVYSFPLSEEWKAWKAMDAEVFAQGDWAAFIEEHIAELAAPYDAERSEFERLFQTKIATPAELITLSRGLQVTVESKVSEFRMLQSGEAEISYAEVHRDGSGQKLIIPGLFIVSVPLFVDAEKTRLIAHLRYRKKDSGLIWFYQLYRADAIVREAMRQDSDKAAAETALPMFEGSPETV